MLEQQPNLSSPILENFNKNFYCASGSKFFLWGGVSKIWQQHNLISVNTGGENRSLSICFSESE
jgi:hypothetical protein